MSAADALSRLTPNSLRITGIPVLAIKFLIWPKSQLASPSPPAAERVVVLPLNPAQEKP